MTPLGIYVFFIMLASASFINTFSNMVYQIFSFLFPAFLFSFLWSLRRTRSFEYKRHLPEYGTAGIQATYLIEIKNTRGAPCHHYFFKEVLLDPRPTFSDFVTRVEPNEDQRVWWDRKTKIYRWFWHIRKNMNADLKSHPIPMLPGMGKEVIQVGITPLNRGFIEFDGITFLRPDPLGLTMSLHYKPSRDRLMVLPKRYQLPMITLPGKRRHHSGGIALSSSVGNSDEFISLREYRVGDSLKMIHWKSFAKTGKLIIRENQDEHFVRHAVVLDTFTPIGGRMIFEEAVSVAASFVAGVKTGESILDFMFVGERAHAISTGRGVSEKKKILEILVSIEPSRSKPFSMLKNIVLRYADLLSGCILILTHVDEERRALIAALAVQKIPLKVFLIQHVSGDSKDPDTVNLYRETALKTLGHPLHFLRVGAIQEDLNHWEGA